MPRPAMSQRQTKGMSDSVGTETVKMVNLPGDVLYPQGRSEVTAEGREVFSVDEFHAEEVLPFELRNVVDAADVRMRHLACDADFGKETLTPHRVVR